MYIYLQILPGKKSQVMNRVKEFEDVVSVESILGQNELLVKLEPFFAADVQKIKKLRSRFTKLKNMVCLKLTLYKYKKMKIIL